MLLDALPYWVEPLLWVATVTFCVVLLLAVTHAKRDVTINITLFEFNR